MPVTNIDSGKNDQLNELASVTEILTDLPSNKFADKSDSQLLSLMQTPQSQPISTKESNQAGRENEAMECNPNASHTHSPIARRIYHHMQLHLLQKHLQDLVESQKYDVDLLLLQQVLLIKLTYITLKKAKAKDINVKCKKTNDIKKSKVTEQA